ncbi:MAG: hypothetical protein WCO04_19765, partial [Pseudomonadota bacterium]
VVEPTAAVVAVDAVTEAAVAETEPATVVDPAPAKKPTSRSRSSSLRSPRTTKAEAAEPAAVTEPPSEPSAEGAVEAEKPKKKPTTRTNTSRAKSTPAKAKSGSATESIPVSAEDAVNSSAALQPDTQDPIPQPEPASTTEPASAPTFPADPGEAPVAETLRPDPQDTGTDDGPAKPRKKGWWSLGR